MFLCIASMMMSNMVFAGEENKLEKSLNDANSMTIKEVKNLILNGTFESENDVWTNLERLECEEGAEVNYLYGVIYYFGLMGQKSLERAIHYLDMSVALKHIEASYLLGTIYVTESEMLDIKAGVERLEFAAKNGHSDAMFNLFSLFKKGVYTNEKAARNWLIEAANTGAENSALIYAQELYSEAKKSSSSDKVTEALRVLVNTQFHEFEGEAYFLAAQIYGNSNFSKSFSKAKRDQYLEQSANLGFSRAVELWSRYEELKQESQ